MYLPLPYRVRDSILIGHKPEAKKIGFWDYYMIPNGGPSGYQNYQTAEIIYCIPTMYFKLRHKSAFSHNLIKPSVCVSKIQIRNEKRNYLSVSIFFLFFDE